MAAMCTIPKGIQKLPNEILGIIFVNAVETSRPDGMYGSSDPKPDGPVRPIRRGMPLGRPGLQRWVIMVICHRWKEVMESTPRAWTTLIFTGSLSEEGIETALTRSGICDLDIHLNIDTCFGALHEWAFALFAKHSSRIRTLLLSGLLKNSREAKTILEVLFKHTRPGKMVTIGFYGNSSLRSFVGHKLNGSSQDLALRSLTNLRVPWDSSVLHFLSNHFQLPELASIDVWRDYYNLSCHFDPYRDMEFLLVLADFVKKFPRISSFQLSFIPQPLADNGLLLVLSHLPNITTLAFRGNVPVKANIFGLLTVEKPPPDVILCPRLTTVVLDHTELFPETTRERFKEFYRSRTSPNIDGLPISAIQQVEIIDLSTANACQSLGIPYTMPGLV